MKPFSLAIAWFVATHLLAQTPPSPPQSPTDTLSSKEVHLNSALVVGTRQDKVKQTLMGVNYLRPEYIKSIPTLFGEVDVVKALQMQPGVSIGIEGFSGMLVRGGNDDQNLFLIDGNPIYQMNHAGGLFSPYNVEAIKDVAFYKSSFPSRYGGRLSSVVDIDTRSGNLKQYHGAFNLGLVAANFSIGGPIVKDRTTFHLALRRSWLDLLTTPALAIVNMGESETADGAYLFQDLNFNLSHLTSRWGTFSLSAYAGQDHLGFGVKDIGSESDKFNLNTGLNWGNLMGALKWRMPIAKGWLHNLSLSYTQYGSKFELNNEFRSKSEDGVVFEDISSRSITNKIQDYSLRSQWLYTPSASMVARFGMDYVYHLFTPEQFKETSNNPLLGFAHESNHIKAHDVGVYGDIDWSITHQLNTNLGLRLSSFNVQSKHYVLLEPRLALNYKFRPDMSLKASYARMSQYVQRVSDTHISLPTDYWMPITERFPPVTSDLVAAGMYYTFHNRWNISLEAWYKRMNHLLEYRSGHTFVAPSSDWTYKLTQGQGKAYGIDLQIEKNYGKLAGYLGYGLLWTERLFPELNNGQPFPSKYDNRHKLNIALSFRPSRRWELNAAWTLMSGNLITLPTSSYRVVSNLTPNMPSASYHSGDRIEHTHTKNNYRLPTYQRLDLGINYNRFHKKPGRTSTWSLSVYNAYAHFNPMIIIKEEGWISYLPQEQAWRQHKRFRSFSLFPILPSISYTYRF